MINNRFYIQASCILVLSILVSLTSCKDESLFRQINQAKSGITFENKLSYNNQFNIFRYRNFYNGGGVALADFNNDGLLDIYFVANMGPNQLYQNLGEFKFRDITQSAGVSGSRSFSTGVSAADVNADGWIDIYVCNSGDIAGDDKQNELFINNGDGTFSEKGEEYGLANRGFSTHAAFFDYDRDGDLDMYLLNNSYRAIGSFDQVINERSNRSEIGGDKLYRNDEGFFTDVTEDAGIYSSVIGFGLGVTVGDVNSDGWQDMYISNDFFERDYLYINNRKGGFEEVLEDEIKSTSAASMGADMADIDNDGYPEIFVTDMLPDTDSRMKVVTTFDSWDRYITSVSNGYWHQFTRNTLQYNNGDDTFSEIGRYAGVEASDWSWASIIFDFDNDGFKDIFVANGIYQDLTNQDFLQFATQDEVTMRITSGGVVDFEMLIGYIPSNPIPNQAFVNNHDLTFKNEAITLGLGAESFSSGSAYGDLDNDGDLDLVVNNTNMSSFLFENRTEKVNPQNRYLRFILKGENGNTSAVGARIKVFTGEGVFQVDNIPNRGFESTVDNRPIIGLGKNEKADSVEIWWPAGKVTRLYEIATNQVLELSESKGRGVEDDHGFNENEASRFIELDSASGIDYRHVESKYSDFDRERLIFQMMSAEGPCMCSGDVNNDGLDDIFIGGASGYSGQLFGQQPDGTFLNMHIKEFDRTKMSEDVDCSLFDANGDGNLDLYVASGSNEFNPNVPELNDRLFFGKGDFDFELVRQTLPAGKFESTSVVKPADFDKDGDMDLFVGVRMKPFFYGIPTNGYILENNGKGIFSNISEEVAPDLSNLGMITGASWVDLDSDDDLDLVIVGEWMPITVFINESGKWTRNNKLFRNTRGFWNVIETGDLNGDGLMDVIAGNLGYNSRLKGSVDRPLTMFVKDFDSNGLLDQIICKYEGNKLYPLPLKHDLQSQLPFIKTKYPRYESYSGQEITDIFSSLELKDAMVLTAEEMGTALYLNNGDLTFSKLSLPPEIQYSTTNAISILDFNDDSFNDILIGGNYYRVKPEIGRYDASYGTLLAGDGTGKFNLVPVVESGLKLDHQVKKIIWLQTVKGKQIVVANNNDRVQTFREREK